MGGMGRSPRPLATHARHALQIGLGLLRRHRRHLGSYNGVAAGVPLADVTSRIVASLYARKVRTNLRREGLLNDFDTSDVQGLIGLVTPASHQ